MRQVTYDQPMAAELQVRLASGKTWKASSEDLKKFGFVDALETYMFFVKRLTAVLEEADLLPTGDITDAELNPIRYLVEVALNYQNIIGDSDMAETYEDIAEIERTLKGFRKLRHGR